MTKNEMETFRPQLLKLVRQLRGDVDALEDEAFHRTDGMAVGNLSNVPVEDRADLAFDNNSEEGTIGLAENASARLEEVDAALGRIDEKTFGVCEECGRDISNGRLQAIPFARLCIDCAPKAIKGNAASPGNL